jgi:hypothetical protein
MNKDDQDARLRQMSRPEFEEMQTTVGYDVHMEEAWGRAYMEEDPRFREKTNLSIIESAKKAGNRRQGLRLHQQHQIRMIETLQIKRRLIVNLEKTAKGDLQSLC